MLHPFHRQTRDHAASLRRGSYGHSRLGNPTGYPRRRTDVHSADAEKVHFKSIATLREEINAAETFEALGNVCVGHFAPEEVEWIERGQIGSRERKVSIYQLLKFHPRTVTRGGDDGREHNEGLGTIEWRQHAGTTDPQAIRMWVWFVSWFCAAAAVCEEDVIDGLVYRADYERRAGSLCSRARSSDAMSGVRSNSVEPEDLFGEANQTPARPTSNHAETPSVEVKMENTSPEPEFSHLVPAVGEPGHQEDPGSGNEADGELSDEPLEPSVGSLVDQGQANQRRGIEVPKIYSDTDVDLMGNCETISQSPSEYGTPAAPLVETDDWRSFMTKSPDGTVTDPNISPAQLSDTPMVNQAHDEPPSRLSEDTAADTERPASAPPSSSSSDSFNQLDKDITEEHMFAFLRHSGKNYKAIFGPQQAESRNVDSEVLIFLENLQRSVRFASEVVEIEPPAEQSAQQPLSDMEVVSDESSEEDENKQEDESDNLMLSGDSSGDQVADDEEPTSEEAEPVLSKLHGKTHLATPATTAASATPFTPYMREEVPSPPQGTPLMSPMTVQDITSMPSEASSPALFDSPSISPDVSTPGDHPSPASREPTIPPSFTTTSVSLSFPFPNATSAASCASTSNQLVTPDSSLPL